MADSGIKRNIPIKLGDFSVIDTEFSNIRERFDAEMRKMEDEMSRFRSELMNRESNNFFKSTTRFMQNTKRRQRANRCIESTTANSCCPREPIPKALSLR
ncbi:uncharacterized protein LOC100867320 isoform X4 [Apis florea]|uniref:uncharacterized protein LOC100867320 isoform X4 n=1 Tax=Apis florea TaxID=7463 RepID=UPI0012FEF762|nr:uncharacterized protein LOC100867320 isoform X4 [Apis florea]